MPPGMPFLILVFLLVVVCTVLMVLLKAAAWWGQKYPMSTQQASHPARRSVQEWEESPETDAEPEPERVPNLASESRTDDRTETFALNDAERLAVTKMIYHKVSNAKATKASTILAGFDVKKGESAAYRRASAIYDALFVLPDPKFHPARTPEQDQSRSELGLAAR